MDTVSPISPLYHIFERRGEPVTILHTIEQLQAIPPAELPLYIMSQDLKTTVEVRDNNEPLVMLQELLRERSSAITLTVGAAYGARDMSAYRLRRSAAERLLQAEQYIQDKTNGAMSLRLTDAFRPISLQREYFTTITEQLRATGLAGQELYTQVTKVIADPDRCPPHSTGGTVDLTLYHVASGEEAPLGTAVDEVENPAAYLWARDIPEMAKRWRSLLYDAMREAGFAESSSEWWHYSYGDLEWGLRTGALTAIYGTV